MCPFIGRHIYYGVGSMRLRDLLSLLDSSLFSSQSPHSVRSGKIYSIFPELPTQTQRLTCLLLFELSKEFALESFKAS